VIVGMLIAKAGNVSKNTLMGAQDMTDLKGSGTRYNPMQVLEEYECLVAQGYLKKQVCRKLGLKYNKHSAHIRRIVREARSV
jgi:hypothetical protein